MQPQCPWCSAPITAQEWLMSALPFRFTCTRCRRAIPLKGWVVALLALYLVGGLAVIALVFVQSFGDRSQLRTAMPLTFGALIAGAAALELLLLRLDPVRRQ